MILCSRLIKNRKIFFNILTIIGDYDRIKEKEMCMKKLNKILTLALSGALLCSTGIFSSCMGNVAEATRTQEITAVKFNLSYEDSFDGYKNSRKIDGAANLLDGDADLNVKTNGKSEDAHLRSWYAFVSSDDEYRAYSEIHDFLTGDYDYHGQYDKIVDTMVLDEDAYKNYLRPLLQILGAEVPENASLIELTSPILGLVSSTVLHELDSLGCISQKGDTAKVDAVKLINNFKADYEEFLNDIDENTKLSDVLTHKNVKKYMNALLCNVKADTIKKNIPTVLESFQSDFNKDLNENILEILADCIKLMNISPDFNSSAYEYLVKLVSSEEFSALIKNATDEEFDVQDKLKEFGIDDDSIHNAKTLLDDLVIKDNSIVYTKTYSYEYEDGGFSAYNYQYTYTPDVAFKLKGGTIAGIVGDYKIAYEYTNEYNYGDGTTVYSGERETSVSIDGDFLQQKEEMEDIGKYKLDSAKYDTIGEYLEKNDDKIEPLNSHFNFKPIIIAAVIVLVIVGVVAAVLILLKKMNIFDIGAFMGNLGKPKAGTGGAEPKAQPVQPVQPVQEEQRAVLSSSSIEDLKAYKQLLDDGVITQEEFDAKKKQILGL